MEKGLSELSISAYENDVKKLLNFAVKEEINSFQQIDLNFIEGFLLQLNQLGMSSRSQARILSGIKAFFSYLMIEEIIDSNPTKLIEGPKQANYLPEVMTIEEVEDILKSIDLSTDYGHRNRAMLEILYACGLRVSELVSLQISHLYFDLGIIKVLGKNNKERLIPIGETAVKFVQIYLQEFRRTQQNVHKGFEDILFLNRRGKALTRNMVFLIVKEAAQKAKINKKVSPHTFRHSFATHMVEAGADLRAVQEMLGHESITTTEIYTHLDIGYLRETVMKFHPLNQKQ